MTAIRELVDEVRLVSEQELLDTIRTLLLDEHVVAEAAGAAATAAFLQDPSDYADAKIVLLVTGRICPRKFFVAQSARNFDAHDENASTRWQLILVSRTGAVSAATRPIRKPIRR